MPSLDLLSQVLFVGLMAMFLYVLYRRFIAMMMRGRNQGVYARVVSCTWSEEGHIVVTIEAQEVGSCHVEWEGGESKLDVVKGTHEHHMKATSRPVMLKFDFGNQVVRRRVDL